MEEIDTLVLNLQRIFTDKNKVGNLIIHSMYLFQGRLCYITKYDQSLKNVLNTLPRFARLRRLKAQSNCTTEQIPNKQNEIMRYSVVVRGKSGKNPQASEKLKS